jgi:uncharacterized membrane protein
MAEHKFVYTVSSKAALSEAHKSKISQAITVAVAQTLAELHAGHERAEFLNVGRIYGGLWIDTVLEANQLRNILQAQEVAVGARET